MELAKEKKDGKNEKELWAQKISLIIMYVHVCTTGLCVQSCWFVYVHYVC